MKTTLIACLFSISSLSGTFAAPATVSTRTLTVACADQSNYKWCLGYAQAVIDMERANSDRYPECDINTYDLIETVLKNPTTETRAHQAILNAWTVTCR